MQFRLTERHIIAVNFLLIAALAYFAARTVNSLVALRLAPTAVVRGQAHGRTASALIEHPRSYYDQIVSRDIFNLAPAPQEKAPVVVEDLHLKLLGISIMTGARPFIIVQSPGGQQALYRLDDMIPNVGKVVKVETDRAIIDHQGRRVALEFPKDMLTSAESRPSAWRGSGLNHRARQPTPKASDDIADLGGNRYAIPRRTVDSNLNNLSELFTQIRAIPNVQDGRTNGFSLSEIQPGSVFDDLGLQDGDVLTAIDGQPINDPARAIQLLNSLRDRRMIQLQVMRDGHPVSFTYEIH